MYPSVCRCAEVGKGDQPSLSMTSITEVTARTGKSLTHVPSTCRPAPIPMTVSVFPLSFLFRGSSPLAESPPVSF